MVSLKGGTRDVRGLCLDFQSLNVRQGDILLDRAIEQKITVLIQPTLEGMGYEIVRVLIQGKGGRIVQVMAERQDRAAMSVNDCASLSRAVSAVLDVADLIQGPHVLEVSSPGLERPLTRPVDFTRFVGYETLLETWRAIAGRRRFRGRLLGLSAAGAVRLALCDGEEVVIPHVEVAKAKLVLALAEEKQVSAKRKERSPRRHERHPRKRQEGDSIFQKE